MSRPKLSKRKYIVLLQANYEITVEAETAQDAEAEARYVVQGSTSDSPLLGIASWTFNAVAEDEWGV